MEIAQRRNLVALLVASLRLASSNGDIIVQPGYERESSIVGNSRINYPGEPVIQPGYEQTSFSSVDPPVNPSSENFFHPGSEQRYRQNGPATTPCNCAMKPKSQTTLNDEIQHNQNLQQILARQMYWMKNTVQQPRQIQQIARETVANPLFQRLLRIPQYSGINQNYPIPQGLRGLNNGQYEWSGGPVLSHPASSSSYQNFADKIMYPRSVDDESRTDTGLEKFHDVAAEPPVEQKNVSEVIDSPAPDIAKVEDSNAQKLVESRQVDMPDYEYQRYPIITTSMTSRTVDTANSKQQKILDNTTPTVTGYKHDWQRQNSQSREKHWCLHPLCLPGPITNPLLKVYPKKPCPPSGSPSGHQRSPQSNSQLHYQRCGLKPDLEFGYQPDEVQSGVQTGSNSGYRPGYQPAVHVGNPDFLQIDLPPRYPIRYLPSGQNHHECYYVDRIIGTPFCGNQYHNHDSYQRSRNASPSMAYEPRPMRLVDPWGRALSPSLLSTANIRFVDPIKYFQIVYDNELVNFQQRPRYS